MGRHGFLLMLFFVAVLSGTANAQFFLEEGKVTLAVSSGERVSKTISINNTSADELKVKAYWEDFKYQPPYDGAKAFAPAGTLPGSMHQWVSYAPQEFTLPPFGKQEVEYTLSTPADMNQGYYGVLFFEKAGDPIKDATGVSIVTRVGCLFFVEPKERNKQALLDNFKLTANTLSAVFINQGNVILIPKTTYYVIDEEGVMADRGEIKNLYVPPGASAAVEISLAALPKQGRYTLVINADLDQGDVVVRELVLSRGVDGAMTLENVQN